MTMIFISRHRGRKGFSVIPSAFLSQEEKQADGDDEKGFDDNKKAVGEKEGNQNAKTKGKNSNPDQLSYGNTFHNLPPLLRSISIYAKGAQV